MLDFRINTFLAVCAHMNYTRAAEELHITQPAVSQHIRYLETLYHTELFIHEGKKIQLSPAGKVLLQTATALKNDENLMIDQMQHHALEQLPLIFGITMTIGEFVIAKPLARYIKNHPDHTVKMIMSNTADLLSGLNSGAIHFALVEGYFAPDKYDYLTYSTEAFIPVCSANHSFKKEPECLADLLSQRLLLREAGSGTRDILERNLSAKNLSFSDFTHVSEISSMHTIVQLLAEDCGISFLYKAAVEKELDAGILRELHLSDFQMTHDFVFIWNKGSLFSGSYRSICQELQGE